MRTSRFLQVIAQVIAASVLAAATAYAQAPQQPAGQLPGFRSDAELTAFLQDLARDRQRHERCGEEQAVLRTRKRTAGRGRNAGIHGRVTDNSGTGIAGAQVLLTGTQAGNITAPDGRYRLEIPAASLPKKRELTLQAQVIGFRAQSLQLSLSPADSVVVDFVLCRAALYLESIVVSSHIEPEEIANVQHAGVDEGGIVKPHGDHLVILRRGRLFTVRIGDGSLEAVSSVNAFDPDIDPAGTWYDELLVSGDNVVVIGFSYARGGTELGLFRIDARGKLSHRATYHLRSDDYYSSRNYSSRLVGNRLVLYTPVGLGFGTSDASASLPAMRRWHARASDAEFRSIITARRVYRPGADFAARSLGTLHTVTVCDLSGAELRCEATSLVAPSGRVFYVSPTAVYVWVSESLRSDARSTTSMLYRLPLNGGSASALRVEGIPVDQFSFLETDDGWLNVLVRSAGRGETMWGAEFTHGSPRLLRVPLSRFSNGTSAAPASAYQQLPEPSSGGTFHNRFVGDHLLYGHGSGWGAPENQREFTLHAVRWRDGAVAALSLPHGVDRIEVMGSDAVVIGAAGEDLHFTGIDLGALPTAVQRYVHHGASQGELRSHGFFYRNDGPDAGIIGLPVRGGGRPGYRHLLDNSASVVFVLNRNARFQVAGELIAHAGQDTHEAADGCVASCVDWYGNSRPLFIQRRIFALMGYEIVEGTLADGRMRELRRVDFAPRHATSATR